MVERCLRAHAVAPVCTRAVVALLLTMNRFVATFVILISRICDRSVLHNELDPMCSHLTVATGEAKTGQ